MAALAKMGILTEAEALQLTDQQANYLAEVATLNLQQLALTNAQVQAALKQQMAGSVRTVRSMIAVPPPSEGEGGIGGPGI